MSRIYTKLSVFLAISAYACGSSLVVPDDSEGSFVPDGGIEGLNVLDASDNRSIPSTCSSDEVCNDGDPCTRDRCRGGKCSFSMADVRLKAFRIDTAGSALDVALGDGFLYVAEGSDGVEVFDTTEPSSHVLMETMDTMGDAIAVEADERGAVVAEGESGIETFSAPDFRQRAHVLPGDNALEGLEEVLSVGMYSGPCIAAGYSDGVSVFDLRTISNPIGVSHVDTQGRAVAAASDSDTFGLVADSLGGAAVVIYHSEEGTVIGAKVPTEGRVVDVDISGDTGLMAEYGAGFGVLDLSKPGHPERLARAPTESPGISCVLLGRQTAAVAEEDGRVVVYDLRDPLIPVVVSAWNARSTIKAVDSRRDLIAVALGGKGAALLTTGCQY